MKAQKQAGRYRGLSVGDSIVIVGIWCLDVVVTVFLLGKLLLVDFAGMTTNGPAMIWLFLVGVSLVCPTSFALKITEEVFNTHRYSIRELSRTDDEDEREVEASDTTPARSP